MNYLVLFFSALIGWFCFKKLLKLALIIGLLLGGWFFFKASAASNLPLPRFASLRSNEVNLRVGPGAEYPIEWVFKQEKMPVEILREFDTWRKIRDYEGAEGWVHQNMLSGKRTVVVTSDQTILRKHPDLQATRLAHIDPGVIGKLLECRGSWCRLQIDHFKGWLSRHHLWGVYPDEFTGDKN